MLKVLESPSSQEPKLLQHHNKEAVGVSYSIVTNRSDVGEKKIYVREYTTLMSDTGWNKKRKVTKTGAACIDCICGIGFGGGRRELQP